MDLELATTRDILEELRNREMRFVFAGIAGRNCDMGEIYLACQGRSEREVLFMLLLLQRRLIQSEGQG